MPLNMKQKVLYGMIIFIVVVVGVFLILLWRNPLLFDKQIHMEKKLYSISKTITTEELEQRGYIDTTNVQQTENEKIERFLQKAQNHQKATLKTFQIQENELYVKIFYYDSKTGNIRMLTYLPKKQAGTAPETYADTFK